MDLFRTDIYIRVIKLNLKDMRRYNLFRIHKGLRALLYDTALVLQKTEFADFEQSDAALEKLSIVEEFFQSHAGLEEEFIFSPILKFDRTAVSLFIEQHHEALTLAEEINKLVKILQYTETDSERRIAGSAIMNAYIQFMMFNLKLMASEEMEINHLLWYQFSDAKLVLMEKQILATLSPAEMFMYSKWMVKGLSETELEEWLSGLKKAVRGLVFNSVMNHIKGQLSAESWYKLKDNLAEGAMAA
jgi:hypothetical protein